MMSKKDVEKLNNEQDVLEFFEEYNQPEIERGKMKILHAYHAMIDGIDKLWTKYTNGKTKKEIQAWLNEEELETQSQWSTEFDVMTSEIEKEYGYRIDIDVDEQCVTITYHTQYFWIRYDTQISKKKPTLSEMNFEVELDDEAHFLVDLITALIYRHKEEQ